MSNFADQIDRLAFNALNGSTGDPIQGQPVGVVSGLITVGYDGQLGQRYCVTGFGPGPESTRLSATATGTLYGGLYQYVLFLSTATAANVRGQLAFWSDALNAVVTGDVTAATDGLCAGVILNAVTKGNYGWIQIAGIASILFKATITKTTPAAGDLVIVDQTPAAKGDILADATALTSVTAKGILGKAIIDTPVGGTVTRVLLWPLGANAAF